MCLNSIKKTVKVPKEKAIKAYKVFRIGPRGKLSFVHMNIYNRVRKDRPMKALVQTIRLIWTDFGPETYPSGFHAFTSRSGADNYRKGRYNSVVREVLLWGEITFGKQNNFQAVSASHMKVLPA